MTTLSVFGGISAKVRGRAIKKRDASDEGEGGRGEDCDDMKKQTSGGVSVQRALS